MKTHAMLLTSALAAAVGTDLAAQEWPISFMDQSVNFEWVTCSTGKLAVGNQGGVPGPKYVQESTIKLTKASGVPGGTTHQYRFDGTCGHLNAHRKTSTTGTAVYSWSSTEVWSETIENPTVLAGGQFTPATGEYFESFRVSAKNGTHELKEQFKCNADPVVGPAKCTLVAASAEPKLFPGWLNVAKYLGRPMLAGKASLAQATALSAASAPQSAPPPPPPDPQPAAARRAAAAAAIIDNMIVITRPVANASVSGSLVVDVRVGKAIVDGITANGVMVRQVQLEWQAAPGGGGRLRVQPWQNQTLPVPMAWAGKSGTATLARGSVDAKLLSGFPRWRVRATIPGSNAAPSPWIEFRFQP